MNEGPLTGAESFAQIVRTVRTAGVLGAAPRIAQVGVVTRDLERSVRAFGELIGLSPWSLYTYGPELLREMTYHGSPAEYSMRIALTGSDPVVELIEPLTGPSIYHDWLDAHGEGLHHVAIEVPSISEGIATATRAGFEILQSGRGYGLDGDGGFAYLDTYEQVRIIVELLEFPKRRREPETVCFPEGLRRHL